jgi:hypothetical protein
MVSSSRPSLFGLWSSSEIDSLPTDGSVNGEIEEFIIAGTAFGMYTYESQNYSLQLQWAR